MSNIKDFEIENGVLEAYQGTGGAVQIPHGVRKIGDEAFRLCTAMTSLVIPETVTEIGNGAFEGCTKLQTLTIPKSVRRIGDGAFCFCTGLSSIEVQADNPVYHSAGSCLIKTKTGTLVQGCNGSVIPTDGSVCAIADEAFFGCTGLCAISIPACVTSIGEGAFSCCTSLAQIVVENGNPVYHSAGNCIIETATKTLIQGCYLSVIPRDGSVCTIGEGAFRGTMALSQLTLPEGIATIGDSAFKGCTALTSIELPRGLKSVGWEAFAHCTALSAILFPEGVTQIGDEACAGCTSLTAIMLPETLEYVGEWAFYHCEKLRGIYFTGSEATWSRLEKPDDLFPDNTRIRFDCKMKNG